MRNNKAKQYNITYKIQMPSLRRDKGDISIRVSFNSIQYHTIHPSHRITTSNQCIHYHISTHLPVLFLSRFHQLVLLLFRGLGLGSLGSNVNVDAVGIMDITKSHEMRHVIHWKHGTDGEKEMNRLALLW